MSSTDHDHLTAAPIEVVSWTNEEGARFPPAMLGSGVFGGAFSLEEGLGATAQDGTVLVDELTRIGIREVTRAGIDLWATT